MKKHYLRLVGPVCALLLLTACIGPKTPQEVTQVFWESVIRDQAAGVVEYSTLTDAQQFDAFSQDWSGFQPSWGKVIIDGNQASVVSEFSKPGQPESESRYFVTWLVQQDKAWKVDYARTGEELRGGALTHLFGQLDQLGKKISAQFKSSSEDLSVEIERINEKLKGMSESVARQASESVEKYSEKLRLHIEELTDSVERALKERENQLSSKERKNLTRVVAELDESHKQLSHPSLESIVEGNKSINRAQHQLAAIDDKAAGNYKDQWREWEEQFQADMQAILDELYALLRTE